MQTLDPAEESIPRIHIPNIFPQDGKISLILNYRYRPPECLLTDGYYDSKMVFFLVIIWFKDLWGVGCVFFEILTLYPLFPGKDELD